MKVARSAYVTLKSLIFAKQKATLKIKIQNSTFVRIFNKYITSSVLVIPYTVTRIIFILKFFFKMASN